jgi:hypothetical protein
MFKTTGGKTLGQREGQDQDCRRRTFRRPGRIRFRGKVKYLMKKEMRKIKERGRLKARSRKSEEVRT